MMTFSLSTGAVLPGVGFGFWKVEKSDAAEVAEKAISVGYRGTSVIPKTTNIARMKENLAIFDFELSPDEMHSISGLDRHRRFNDPGVFCEMAFNTFCPIYE